MRGVFRVEPSHQNLFHFIDESRPFESVCEYFGFPLEAGQNKRSQFTRKVLSDPEGRESVVYFKLYGYGKFRRALSRFFKPSRSKSERKNLKFFSELGIPACEPIAQGEYRTAWGLLKNCIIVTKEVTGSKQLDVFIDELEAGDEDEAIKADLRIQIIESLANNLKKLHARRFYHEDLKWRNVLVRRVGARGEKVEVFWIDCPNGYFDWTGFLRRKHGVIKDIATLDHVAWKRCTLEERLHFLSVYTGAAVGAPELEKFADQVLSYRKRRLDD